MNRSAIGFTTFCVLGILAFAAPVFPQGTTDTRPVAVAASGILSKVAPLVAAGRARARAWQADARLIGVFVKAGLDGKVDLAHLAGQTNMDGGFVSLHFHSTAAGSGQAYTLDASGRLVGFSMPVGTATPAIPEKFLDLDDAMVKARELGLKLPPAGAKGFVDARLVGVNLEAPRAVAATWTIMAVDMSGQFPMPIGEPVVVNAATGEQTTEEALSGRLERRMLAEELTRGKTFPASQRDYAFYRAEADAWAARWNEALKLGGIEVSGPAGRGGFSLERVTFLYFAPAARPPGAFISMAVAVFPRDGGMLLRAEDLDHELDPAGPRPQAAPDRFLVPDAAVGKLLEAEPRLQVAPATLQLVCGASLLEAMVRSRERVNFDVAVAIKDRWLWTSRAERTVRERESIFVWDRTILEAVAIDAITGVPVLNGGAPAASRPAERAPARIDRFLVGSWKGSIPEGEITLELVATGDFKMNGSGGGRTLEQTGTIEAVDGKWQMHASTGETFGGTYRMSDKNTLAWIDPKADRTVTLRRTDGSPRNPRPPDLRPTTRGEDEGPASRR